MKNTTSKVRTCSKLPELLNLSGPKLNIPKMKHFFIVFLFLCTTIYSFAQFNDTTELNAYIRDTIRDRRPDKVKAEQIQKSLLGIVKFIPLTTPLNSKQIAYGNGSNILTGNPAFTFNDTTSTLFADSVRSKRINVTNDLEYTRLTHNSININNSSGSDNVINVATNSPSFRRISVSNSSSHLSAGAGSVYINDIGHILQYYVGSSNNAFVPNGVLFRSTGTGGLNIVADAGPIAFGKNAGIGVAEFARFTSNGRLGLGTTTPSHLLDISQSLTGTDALSIVNAATTWNTSGNPTALKLNVTNTASGSTSNLMDIQQDGVSRLTLPVNSAKMIFNSSGINLQTSGSAAGGISLNGTPASSNTMVVNPDFTLSNSTGLTVASDALRFTSAVVTHTDGTVNLMRGATSFQPTGGSGIFNMLHLNSAINQTGGANGVSRGLYVNPTITSAADFRAIEVATGKSVFNGPVSINTSVSPTAGLLVGAGSATAGTAPVKLTAGPILTTPESGAIEYDGTGYYFTDASGVRRNLAQTDRIFKIYSRDYTDDTIPYNLIGWDVQYVSDPELAPTIVSTIDIEITLVAGTPAGTIVTAIFNGQPVYTLTVSGTLASEAYVIGTVKVNQDIKYPTMFYIKGATETINGAGVVTSTNTAFRIQDSFTNPPLWFGVSNSGNMVRIGSTYTVDKKQRGRWLF